MIKILTQSRNDRSRFETRILLGVLVIVVIVGFGATTYTASGAERDRLSSGRLRYFDPFELATIYLDVPESAPIVGIASPPETEPSLRVMRASPVLNNPSGLPTQSPIIIPYRPTIRSPFRPPLV